MALNHVLRNHAFLHGLPEAHLAQLASLATEVTFEENELILVEGERSRAFYLLAAGSVAIELRTPRITVCVQVLGPDQAFGWSALLDHQDTLFQVRARELTIALRLDGARLAEACHSDPTLGAEFLRRTLRVVAGRVKATEVKFAEMCGVRLAD
ncbi:MAG TPA: cyclic nucleotide-binding domain-containing protein [Bryobacteraceae bacterium]|nr:cyclic nucleotide-binding domain-containing protein [Bryobacteraceae bacterium]